MEPTQVILIKVNGHCYTTTDTNSGYNQIPFEEQLRRLSQFVLSLEINNTRLLH